MTEDDLRPRSRPIPDRHRDGPGAILVGVDGTTSSLRAAAYAAGLARRQRSRLVAVYVRTANTPLLPSTAGASAATSVMEAQDAVERELRAAIDQRAAALDIDVQLIVRTGEPYTELVAAAEEVNADAVIVGRSTKMLHRIAGSLAIKLVRAGRWPVTVVP